jgi:hypothetical protein
MEKVIIKWLTLNFSWQVSSIVFWFLLIRLAYFVIERPRIFMSDFYMIAVFRPKKRLSSGLILRYTFCLPSLPDT